MSDPRPPVARVLRAAARSDAGRVRANNEDLVVLDAERGIYGVIDGVGGHVAGETAAAIARDVILRRLARPLGTPAERVREAIALANNEIHQRATSQPDLDGMTCVVTLALVADGRITIGHVGDSRLYVIRPDRLRKLTHDHSPVGEREDAGELSEAEAMRHPRRHEVFRDVGSARRDKDEPDYVEVVEDRFADDAALLVCTDGLTDMIPSGVIDRVVRTHAGQPDAVVDALIAAANDAGGRDNVTVVYAEAPGFADAMRQHAATAGRADQPSPARRGVVSAVMRSRATWFLLGALVGVASAVLFAWRATLDAPPAPRTIAAGPSGSLIDGAPAPGTLAAAIAEARPGDVIRLEPGRYAERLVVPDGVSVEARVPGAAEFVRPLDATGEWTAITLHGDGDSTLVGTRVVSTPEAPVTVGVRVLGRGASLRLLQIDGPVRVGVDVDADAAVVVMGSTFHVPGPAVAAGTRSTLTLDGNVFRRVGPPDTTPSIPSARPVRRGATATNETRSPNATPAISAAPDAQVTATRNAFDGFDPER